MRVATSFLWDALADKDHAGIVLFSLMLGGMVGVFAKSGGSAGIVQKLRKLSNTRRGGLFMTWILGVLIFFDDYANTLLVGNTMRPFADKLKISRAKLAYIVDSTAAPVASIAVISTWVGFEVGLLKDAAQSIPILKDPYIAFLQSLPYHTYSIMALALVASVIWWGRDIGPMRQAEKNAINGFDDTRQKGALELENSEDVSKNAWLVAVVPIVLVIISTFAGLWITGKAASAPNARFSEIIGNSNSSVVLMSVSFIGMITAAILSMFLTGMKVNDSADAILDGIKAMLPAIVILLLAWSIGSVCDKLGTATVIINAARGNLPPYLIPLTIFLISAITAFSTGTSWGTMAILIPIAIPLAYTLPVEAGLATDAVQNILLASIGSVLAGATFGDHCSPISDTTILSSMASGCDHVAHVRTQIPYAVIAGGVAVLAGYLPAGLGVSPWISLVIGIGIIIFIPKFFR